MPYKSKEDRDEWKQRVRHPDTHKGDPDKRAADVSYDKPLGELIADLDKVILERDPDYVRLLLKQCRWHLTKGNLDD